MTGDDVFYFGLAMLSIGVAIGFLVGFRIGLIYQGRL